VEGRIVEIRVIINDDDGPLTESDRVVAEQLVHRAIDRINLYRFGRKPTP
jgi:hypothetical protein